MSKERPRNWAWISFAYTGFLFLQPILAPNLPLWLGTIAALVAFCAIVVCYIRSTDKGNPARFWMIAATFVLGLITFPWNQGASTFFIYAAALLPFNIESVRRVLWLFLAECIVIITEGSVFSYTAPDNPFHISWPNTLVAIFLLFVIGGTNIFIAEQRRSECKLRAAQDENLALAAVAERERIARDLHDVLGHTLSVIVLKAELAGRLIPLDPVHATAEIGDVERTARTALMEIREAIVGYRARSLAAEIEAAHRTLDAAGVALAAEFSPDRTAALSPREEAALSLAVREAVTNIVRHARATTCHMVFITEAGNRRLIVEDDGPHAIVREGNGLRGMRERIESLGGRLLIESGKEDSQGTRLILELPLREVAAS
jgi:two-component system sensor histidine kinase DesK